MAQDHREQLKSNEQNQAGAAPTDVQPLAKKTLRTS